MDIVHVIGGGLAGCEAAWQLADRGVPVRLIEMRPLTSTGAHRTDALAEIVCTNSFKSTLPDTASGVLKSEMDILGCRLLGVARSAQVPAGHALAVDRDIFSRKVTEAIEAHPAIEVVRHCQSDLDLPRPTIVATGPLTASALSETLRGHCTSDHLYFYDAIAPSIDRDSIDLSSGFWASRYGKGEADYFNIPLTQDQYTNLIERIRGAQKVAPHEFEDAKYFEACLPVEEIVDRGDETLRFGPLKPRGLPDPRTGREPHAVIQLRQESKSGNLLGLVGFQTRMTYAAQKEVINSIPGLEIAGILRYGSIHRNMFLNTPVMCDRYQRDRRISGVFYAGQICGVEGYVECIMSGIVCALAVYAEVTGGSMPALPDESMIGSLMNYVHTPSKNFQPMNANMGLLPATGRRSGPRQMRYLAKAEKAVSAMTAYRSRNDWLFSLGSAAPPGYRPASFA